jgi:hypothetical protein
MVLWTLLTGNLHLYQSTQKKRKKENEKRTKKTIFNLSSTAAMLRTEERHSWRW